MAEQVPVPTSPVKTAAKDVLERAAWTLIQTGVSATIIVTWYQAQGWPDLPMWAVPLVTALLAALLSTLKGYLATKYSANGTASTLPESVAPVRTEKVIVQETASGLAVAGNAVLVDEHGDDIPVGTPVDLGGIAEHENQPTSADSDDLDIEPPPGFDDGSDPKLRTDPPEGTYSPEHAR